MEIRIEAQAGVAPDTGSAALGGGRTRSGAPLLAAVALALALFAIGAIGAVVGGRRRPDRETEPASHVGRTGFVLNATVNPNNSPVSECSFEYGPTESLARVHPARTPPAPAKRPFQSKRPSKVCPKQRSSTSASAPRARKAKRQGRCARSKRCRRRRTTTTNPPHRSGTPLRPSTAWSRRTTPK